MNTEHARHRPVVSNQDEIDLFELFLFIWKRRITLLVFCFVGFLISVAYAFIATEQWTSVAHISAPQLREVSPYLDQRRAVARVTGNKPVDASTLTQELFDRFISQAAAMKNRLAFLSHTDYYKEKIAENNDPETDQRTLIELADNLQIKGYDDKQIAPYYEFSYSAESAADAQEILGGYLSWINDKAFDIVDEGFNDGLDAQILSRRTELEDINFTLRSERQNKIEMIENALHTARLAEIKDYSVARHFDGATVIELSDSRRLFMLGEKYLSAELATAEEAPIIYPPRYYEIKRELEELEPLREYEVKIVSYSYQLPPTLPVTRDKPIRSLIVVLGVLVGGMAGMIWILVSNAIRSKRSMNGSSVKQEFI